MCLGNGCALAWPGRALSLASEGTNDASWLHARKGHVGELVAAKFRLKSPWIENHSIGFRRPIMEIEGLSSS